MKPIPKWLMIPPAVALLLILGPMSMQGNVGAVPQSNTPTEAATSARTTAAPANGRPGEADLASIAPTLPKTPGFWQIGSALVGVLLLGGIGIYGLRRLRGGAVPTRGSKLMTLRQTMRLNARNALHAIEWNDRLLLVGETERGVALLDSTNAPEQVSDEADAAARAAAILEAVMVDHDDDGGTGGAVPKNLVIPRPDNPRRSLPKHPVMPRPAAQKPSLNDFRALLQKAGRA